jgi:O-antigen/teichoic acid export membrane protein
MTLPAERPSELRAGPRIAPRAQPRAAWRPRAGGVRSRGWLGPLAAVWARLPLHEPMIRSSVVTMGGTVVSAGLGYLYWLIVARLAVTAQVGYASSAMSLVTGLSLVTNLGVCGFVVERMPGLEGRRAWARTLKRTLWPTALLSFAVTAAVEIVVVLSAVDPAQRGLQAILVASAAALGLTFVEILTVVFISARRAELAVLLGAVVGVAKVASLAVFLFGGAGVSSLLIGWAAAILLSCVVGALVLLPRAGLGRLGGPTLGRWAHADLRSVLGHHLTSVGGLMVPYLLPTLVVYRLDATRNAYFYATWMFGSIFFMISPSVESALFVEGVRDRLRLAANTRRAFRLLGLLMPVPILLGVFGGRYLLRVFGGDYARNGSVLLAILAIAAVPDAVTNIGAGVLRATGRLRWSALLNVAMGVISLGGAWFALPVMGITGAGVAWLAAQSVGSLAVAPMLCRLWETSAEATIGRPAAGRPERPDRAVGIGPPGRSRSAPGRRLPAARHRRPGRSERILDRTVAR